MATFLIKIKTGPNAGRMFVRENVQNEAEAINQVFEILKGTLEEYTTLEITQTPIHKEETKCVTQKI